MDTDDGLRAEATESSAPCDQPAEGGQAANPIAAFDFSFDFEIPPPDPDEIRKQLLELLAGHTPSQIPMERRVSLSKADAAKARGLRGKNKKQLRDQLNLEIRDGVVRCEATRSRQRFIFDREQLPLLDAR